MNFVRQRGYSRRTNHFHNLPQRYMYPRMGPLVDPRAADEFDHDLVIATASAAIQRHGAAALDFADSLLESFRNPALARVLRAEIERQLLASRH